VGQEFNMAKDFKIQNRHAGAVFVLGRLKACPTTAHTFLAVRRRFAWQAPVFPQLPMDQIMFDDAAK
jgi:hypothetical protein